MEAEISRGGGLPHPSLPPSPPHPTSSELVIENRSPDVGLNREIWDKVLKSGPSKICGRQPLKSIKEYEGMLTR